MPTDKTGTWSPEAVGFKSRPFDLSSMLPNDIKAAVHKYIGDTWKPFLNLITRKLVEASPHKRLFCVVVVELN